jgi:hypothetical protein
MSDGQPHPLNLRVGDLVEVLSEEEILATLDQQGALDGLPLMPEMLEFCGKRFQVGKRADKTCNTITVMESRRLYDTVHLEGLRCSGAAHGGCQAQCLIYWKEAWLKRVEPGSAATNSHPSPREPAAAGSPRCDRTRLNQLTLRSDPPNNSEIFYRCQATDILKASESIPDRELSQFVRDVASGNVGVIAVVRAFFLRLFQKTMRITAFRAQWWAYDFVHSLFGGTPYPYRRGTLDKTPKETLDIQPGELVQVKSYEEILSTLNRANRNRGLFFDAEMVPYCGSTRRVRARVERIIDERSGRMLKLPGECLILEGAVCMAKYSERRLFCPRGIYPFWREIWLKRVEPAKPSHADPRSSEAVEIHK